MKKLYIALLAMTLAVVFAVPAMAIHIGDNRDADDGILGINGKYVLDGEKVDYDGDEAAWYDQDVDVAFTWEQGPVMVYWRAEISDVEGLGGDFNGGGADTRIVDDLWMSYQFNDDLKFKVGEFFIGSSAVADDTTGGFNIQAMYGLDAVDLSFAISKEVEDGGSAAADADGDQDTDRLVLGAKFKEAGFLTKLNLTYIMEDNEVTEEGASFMLLEAGAPAGPVSLYLQYGSFGGTDGTTGADAEGSYYLVTVGLDELVGFGLDFTYFSSTDDLYAGWEEDYTPHQIIMDEVTFPESNANITAMWLSGDYAYNDNLTVGAAYIMANLTEDVAAGDEIGSEIDVWATYKIADNVSYKAAIGSYSDGDLGFGDITKYFNRLTVSF